MIGQPYIAAAAPKPAALRAAKWSAKMINDLPDSAFLYIERGGQRDAYGKTTPRRKRHFPVRDADGNLDLPHLRNAIARIPQSNAPGLTAAKKTALQNKARRLLERAQKASAAASMADLLAADAVELTADGSTELAATADGAAEDPNGPAVKIVAYTGGLMRVAMLPHPVAADLAGIDLPPEIPFLRDHDPGRIVGHGTPEISDGALRATGTISGGGPDADEVVAAARHRFPWRASMGARILAVDFVPTKRTFCCNGQTLAGPAYHVTRCRLGEISFVAIGADAAAAATVAASAEGAQSPHVPTEENTMDPNLREWLAARGFDPDAVAEDEQQLVFLTAAWKAEAWKADIAAPAPAPDPATPDVTNLVATALAQERQRITSIEAACRGFSGERVAELRRQATAGEIDIATLQASLLDHLRADRPAVPVNRADLAGRQAVLQAAACMAAMIPDDRIVATYGAPAAEAAYRHRGMGLQEFIAAAAALEGVTLPRYRDDAHGFLQAAFSTFSVPGILSNVANKALLEAYNYVEQTWRAVCAIGSVKDFKQHTRYRLTDTMVFQRVAPDGEIKHGQVDEQTFTQQADTYALMFSLTRTAIINDDLSAFAAIPQRLGRGAGEAINDAVWTLLLSNPDSFFSAANANLATGAATALSFDSLQTAEQMFLDQTRPNGRPLGIPPSILLVPTALAGTARRLYKSDTVLEGRGQTKTTMVPIANIYAGRFEPQVSAYLSNAAYTGYSATAWYLFADPRILAAIEVAFLNGQQNPTVERADADFNTFGVQFRGYVDFGVAMQDHRAAAKMAGA